MSKSKDLVSRFEKLRKAVADARSEYDRASGVVDQAKDVLKDRFGCSTLQGAEDMLSEMEIKLGKLEDEVSKMLDEFEDNYEDALDDD